MENLLTSAEAAHWLRVSRYTLLKYVRDGHLPHIRMPGGHIRFEADALENWMFERKFPARPVGVLLERQGSRWYCPICEDYWNEPEDYHLWHCTVCKHHWPIGREQCNNCYQVDAPELPKAAP